MTNIAKMTKAMIRDHFPMSLPPPELPPEDFLSPLKNWSNMMKSRSGWPVMVIYYLFLEPYIKYNAILIPTRRSIKQKAVINTFSVTIYKL